MSPLLHQLKTNKKLPGHFQFIHCDYELTIHYTLIDGTINIQRAHLKYGQASINSIEISRYMHPTFVRFYKAELIAQAEMDIQNQRDQMQQTGATA